MISGLKSVQARLLETFSIVTTEANDLMSNIHNSGKRMPVILSKNCRNTMD